jgi:hypothetical protein
VRTPQASSNGGSQNLGRIEVKISCDGCTHERCFRTVAATPTYNQEDGVSDPEQGIEVIKLVPLEAHLSH